MDTQIPQDPSAQPPVPAAPPAEAMATALQSSGSAITMRNAVAGTSRKTIWRRPRPIVSLMPARSSRAAGRTTTV